MENLWENMVDSIKEDIIIELQDEGYEYEDE